MAGIEIERLIRALAKLPGFGPRSARRAALTMLQQRETMLTPLVLALTDAERSVRPCPVCGNLDTCDPCEICADPGRDDHTLCVVEGVADLWALERAGAFRGRYHILGGILSPLDGVGPEDLSISQLVARAGGNEIEEVVLALGATVDGQTTAHYLLDRLADCRVTVSRPAHGVPIGGELDYLDDGTLTTALKARSAM